MYELPIALLDTYESYYTTLALNIGMRTYISIPTYVYIYYCGTLLKLSLLTIILSIDIDFRYSTDR